MSYGDGYIVALMTVIVFSMTGKAVLQFIILGEYVEQFFINNMSNIEDEIYQERIFRAMKFVAVHYRTILRLNRNILDVWKYCVLQVLLIGGISIFLYMLIMIGDVSPNIAKWKVIAGCTAVLYNTILLSHFGQSFSDESERFFSSLSNVPWYTWDTKNKRMLLILLPNLIKPEVIGFGGIVDLNYQLIQTFTRVVYKAACISHSISQK
ncbi:unnamed protein product [Acanthoscelides obtectus]|uniref:Uncharacterized protein n=1 Tax=Acanthoscelides obtectus TaxID=200917 RepID=A0A9P0JKF9_ACAOB|nr:unnamed protein product [Acanthoscelides obtectus]CAK1654979.1 hypothetical protein AOBTE_LOCUS18940 [Acanthoscelides obtectus]